MKKLFVGLIAILMLIAFSACGSDVAYTYEWEEPSFSSDDVTTKQFDDFSIEYPSDWEISVDETPTSVDDAEVFYQIYLPSDSGYYSNLNIIFSASSVVLSSIDRSDFEDIASSLESTYDIEITVSDVQYGKLYGTPMAFCTLDSELNGVVLQWRMQYVPAEDGLYLFTYTLFNGEGASDVENIMNSVHFE
jgi:hypothetical protein